MGWRRGTVSSLESCRQRRGGVRKPSETHRVTRRADVGSYFPGSRSSRANRSDGAGSRAAGTVAAGALVRPGAGDVAGGEQLLELSSRLPLPAVRSRGNAGL